jgi:hypothetical protein
MEDLGCLLAHYLDLVCLPLLSESNATNSILYLIWFLGDIFICRLRFKSTTSSGLGFRDLRMMDHRRRFLSGTVVTWQRIVGRKSFWRWIWHPNQCCQEMTIRTFECIELLSRYRLLHLFFNLKLICLSSCPQYQVDLQWNLPGVEI